MAYVARVVQTHGGNKRRPIGLYLIFEIQRAIDSIFGEIWQMKISIKGCESSKNPTKLKKSMGFDGAEQPMKTYRFDLIQ